MRLLCLPLPKTSEDCRRTDSQMLYFRVYDENWYVAQQPIHEMKISGGRSYSRKWTDDRVNWRRTTPCLRDPKPATKERERKTLSLNSLSASHVGLLALSRRKFSRKTSGPRVAANQFADDLKIVIQVVHTDAQGHSHRRFRGRLCSSLTACRTLKIVLRALRTYR